ncbi:MAG: putative metal-binding motif-containing protein [Sandaracinus sp.]
MRARDLSITWVIRIGLLGIAACPSCSQPVAATPDAGVDAMGLDAGREPDAPALDASSLDAGRDTGSLDACAPATLCLDRDEDLHGNPSTTLSACPGSVVGYVQACDDCDDGMAAIHPDQAEQPCNGLDDDCDPSTNDAASAEICDGLPNDCDMAVDEDFECPLGTTRPCHTACDPTGVDTGTQRCEAGCTWGACALPPETCNGRDDDCNGGVDDAGGFACVQGSAVACTTSCGSTGTGTCTATCTLPTATECTPPSESCDGVDDDCDMLVDEPGCVQNRTGYSCTTMCGTGGLQDCNAACALGTCRALTESCNACDDDVDGRTDEGFGCIRGSTVSCLDGCGSMSGSGTCSGSCSVPSGFPACRPVRDDTYNRTQLFHSCGFDLAGAQYVWCADAACNAQYGPTSLVAYPQGDYRITFALRADGPGPQYVNLDVTGDGVTGLRDDPGDGIASSGSGGGTAIRYALPGGGTNVNPSLLFSLANPCNRTNLQFIVVYSSSGPCTGTDGGLVISWTRVQSM